MMLSQALARSAPSYDEWFMQKNGGGDPNFPDIPTSPQYSPDLIKQYMQQYGMSASDLPQKLQGYATGLDATGVWAQRLGLQDPGGFAARANSGALTQDDIAKIGRTSSVAPQMDANGRVTNASDFFSGAVAKAQSVASKEGDSKFLGVSMPAGVSDALKLGSVYLGGGNLLGGDMVAGPTIPGTDATLASTVGGTAGTAPAASAWPSAPTISQGVNVAGPTEPAAGSFNAGNAANGLNVGAGGQTGLTAGTVSETGSGLGSGITNSLAGNVTPGSLGALSNDALINAGLTGGAGAALAGTGAAGTAAAGGSGTGAAGSAAGGIGGTKLADVLSGKVGVGDLASTLTVGDLSKALGTIGSTALGIVGSNNQANALKDLSDKYLAIGAPSRARYEASFQPGFDVNSIPGFTNAMDTASQGVLRGLSAKGGANPLSNPGQLTEAQNYLTGNLALPALNNYRNQNAATGGFGAFNTAAPGAATGAIGANAGVYNAAGSGVADIFNPPQSLADILKQIRG